ncbi:MAG: hypothetical protein ACE5LB_09010 [Acidiferrobacterales bacterium]
MTLNKQIDLGLRWLRCGWRLLRRNPLLLLGMALVCVVIITLLTLIPLFGNFLAALLVPVFVSSAMLVTHDLSKQKMTLPASLWMAALARSPKELFRVLTREERMIPVLVLCIYVMAVAVLTGLVAYAVTGGAWLSQWAGLDIGGVFQVLFGWLVLLLLYFVLAASLIYSIPLTFLRDEPLIPALGRSLLTSTKYVLALAVLFGVLVAPFLIGRVASLFSMPAGYTIWLVGGTIVLPLAITSCYCSYRTAFPTDTPPDK